MSRKFSDHFATLSQNYADFRPSYPDALFAWLAARVPRHDLAWDCAAGTGQASVGLAAHFKSVVATDASHSQIDAAVPHPRIDYRVAPAEASGLPGASVDLITVAQALHWLDLAAFYAEVARVLRAGGVLAVWTYGVLTVEGDAVNNAVQTFYHETVGPYWPSERVHVENGYRDLAFPFLGVPAPPFAMEACWPLPQLLGYFRSWSATGRFISANHRDPVAALAEQMLSLWGEPSRPRCIRWPLALRIGTPESPQI